MVKEPEHGPRSVAEILGSADLDRWRRFSHDVQIASALADYREVDSGLETACRSDTTSPLASVYALWLADSRMNAGTADRSVSDVPDLDVTGEVPDSDRGRMSLRWVLVHMIEEYARHIGNADQLQERIDGEVGQ